MRRFVYTADVLIGAQTSNAISDARAVRAGQTAVLADDDPRVPALVASPYCYEVDEAGEPIPVPEPEPEVEAEPQAAPEPVLDPIVVFDYPAVSVADIETDIPEGHSEPSNPETPDDGGDADAPKGDTVTDKPRNRRGRKPDAESEVGA